MARLYEDHCECGFFPMNVHLLNHICYDLENVRGIQVFHAARYEHFKVFQKRA